MNRIQLWAKNAPVFLIWLACIIRNGDETELKRLLSIINSHQDRLKRKKWEK